jgi:PhnB protein
MSVKPIPAGYHSVTPYLAVRGAAELLDFLKIVFAAEEMERITAPDGSIGHAEVLVGDSRIMISEVMEKCEPRPASLYLYLEGVDSTYRRALEAGATSTQEPTNQFWGDRQATVKDRFGNEWHLATRVEEVSMEELQRRMAEIFKQ